jgi:chemotaxis protein MotB
MKRLLLLMLLVPVGLLGCTTVQKGAAIGGLAGAAIGGIWAGNAGELSIAEGALVGGAGGGLAGALLGDQLEDKEDTDLQKEVDNLQNMLEAKENLLAQKNASLDEKQRLVDEAQRAAEEKDRRLQELEGQLSKRESTVDDLEKHLDFLEVELAKTPKGITFTIAERVLFTSGSATLTEQGQSVLGEVATIIKERFGDREIDVEGHTDNVPISYSGWKSNWELGAARSLSVLHYLIDGQGFDPAKSSATTYGEFRPVADNETEEGRQKNRRSVVVILPTVEKQLQEITE